MFSMQGAPEEAQQHAPQDQRVSGYLWLIWLIIAAYIGFVAWLLWNDDKFKLNFLHTSAKFLQLTAATAGILALECEHKYYEYAELLH